MVSVSVRVRIKASLFFKHLCDNNARHKVAYNIGNKFDGSGRNYKTRRLATCDGLLGKPEELVVRLAISEATAEVTGHGGCRYSDCRNIEYCTLCAIRLTKQVGLPLV